MKKKQEKENLNLDDEMLDEYDLANMKSWPNPYAKILKKQITIKINDETIDYFKKEASSTGIPYQTLINLYLTDCAKRKKKININWE